MYMVINDTFSEVSLSQLLLSLNHGRSLTIHSFKDSPVEFWESKLIFQEEIWNPGVKHLLNPGETTQQILAEIFATV